MPDTGSSASIAITISTARGSSRGQWRPSSMTRAAAVLLPDAHNSLAGPSGLFSELAVAIQRAGVCVLQLHRCSDDFEERKLALLSALDAVTRQGVERMALIGWHVGATMAIAAGSVHPTVRGVAALAPEAYAQPFLADLAPRSLLLMHGINDRVTPASTSRMLFDQAEEPKSLILYRGDGHKFAHHHEEAIATLTTWTHDLLRCPFKSRSYSRLSAGPTFGAELPLEHSDMPLMVSTAK